MSELRSCPFCGGEIFEGTNIRKKPVMRHRYDTECPPSETVFADNPGFRERWNRRHVPDPVALTVEELQEMPIFGWVWIGIVNPTSKNNNDSAYVRKYADYTRGEVFCCGWTGYGFAYDYDDYCKTWIAYDGEPNK